MDLLAADRFDAEQLGAGGGAALEGRQHRFVERAASHAGRANHLARVVGGDAQDAFEAVLGVRLGHGVQQNAGQLDAPGGVLRHRRQRLELDDQAGRFQFHRPPQRAGDDLLILRAHLRHGRLVHEHRRQGEIQFRIDYAAAEGQAAAGDERFGRDPEAQFGGISNCEALEPGEGVRSGLICGSILHHFGQSYAIRRRQGMDKSRIPMKESSLARPLHLWVQGQTALRVGRPILRRPHNFHFQLAAPAVARQGKLEGAEGAARAGMGTPFHSAR